MRTFLKAAVFALLTTTTAQAATPQAVTTLTLDYLLTGASGLTWTNGFVDASKPPVPASCTTSACRDDYTNPLNSVVFDLSFGSSFGDNDLGSIRIDKSVVGELSGSGFTLPSIAIGSDPAYMRFDLVGGSIDPIEDLEFDFFGSDGSDGTLRTYSFQNLVPNEVPLPASALLLLGAVGAVFARRRQTTRA